MASHMRVVRTPIRELLTIQHEPVGDERGELERLFCAEELAEFLGQDKVVQVNRTRTALVGAIRGMHYQVPPSAEKKFVTCIRGRVFDVAVDVRRGSDTYLKWHGVELSPEANATYAIPEGFAHGFQVLEPESELLYFHTAFYDPKCERGLSPVDATLSIDWPLAITVMSERDRSHRVVDETFEGVEL